MDHGEAGGMAMSGDGCVCAVETWRATLTRPEQGIYR